MAEDPIKEDKKTDEVEKAPVEEPTPSTSEPTVEETVDSMPDDKEQASDKPQEENIEEPKEEPAPQEKKETKEEPKKEAAPVKEKKQKKKEKKPQKEEEEVDEDFDYIVRLSNSDIDGNLRVVFGLSHIKGIGRHMALLVAEHSKVDKFKKMGNLKPDELERIQNTIDNITEIAPSWMLNHRKEMETGEDIHLISTDIGLSLREELNLLKMIRCYRGIRHENHLPVRGQRTRANNRKGLSLGVSKKK